MFLIYESIVFIKKIIYNSKRLTKLNYLLLLIISTGNINKKIVKEIITIMFNIRVIMLIIA